VSQVIHVIGVDPGPTTGIAVLQWSRGGEPDARPSVIWRGYQCDAASAPWLLDVILRRSKVWDAGQEEHFVHGNLPDSPTTTRMEDELAAVAADNGLKLAARPMASVKPWASDKRMIAARAWHTIPEKSTIPAKMVDARAAAKHCLFCAVHDAGVPDPLSRNGKPT
jgi:hypothetical protein